MTTVAQVKKMVQPLLEQHSDLALVGRWIYLKPVHHVARAVLIDRKRCGGPTLFISFARVEAADLFN